MDYIHLIITRFNIRIDEDLRALSEDYLEQRFEIFERYCLPSVLNQTCHDFRWVILFDSATPASFKQRADKIGQQASNIDILFVEPFEDVHVFYEQLAQQYSAGHQYLLTTRFDNDDMLNRHFVEYLHRALQQQTPTFYSFSKGLQYFRAKETVFTVNFINNHFSSLLEDASLTPKTILGYNHIEISQIGTIVNMAEENMWVEIVHETNVCNNFSRSIHPSAKVSVNNEDFPKVFTYNKSAIMNHLVILQMYLHLCFRKIRHLL